MADKELTYDHFEWSVRSDYRFRYDQKQEDFLKLVMETGRDRVEEWPEHKRLWRAQRGSQVENPLDNKWFNEVDGLRLAKRQPYDDERMKPQPYKTKEGRISPKGIPCLYAATDRETAIYEVRPLAHTVVSVAELVTFRSLRLIDCTRRTGLLAYWGMGSEHPEIEMWYAIDRAFSNPVSDTDDTAEYAPTQVLAETFRKEGYDGIIYDSSLCDSGKNIALFNIQIAYVANVTLYKINSVTLASEYFDHTKSPLWY